MESGKKLKIRKGLFELTLDRNRVVSVDPTYEGIVFNFQEGLNLTCVDTSMPSSMKELIKNSINSFPTVNLVVNLANYNKPIYGEVD